MGQCTFCLSSDTILLLLKITGKELFQMDEMNKDAVVKQDKGISQITESEKRS